MSPDDQSTGSVVGLWRYPVKSLRGEPVEELLIGDRGADGDREWALVDREGKWASGKDSRRFRKVEGLMMHSARLVDGAPVLSDTVERIAGADWELRRDSSQRFFDAAPIHLITEATLERLGEAAGAPVEPERVRPNILLSGAGDPGFPEDDWVGATIEIGDVVLRVIERAERCVMTTQAQRGLPRRPEVLKTIGRLNEACAGIYAEVIRGGVIRVGEETRLI